MGCVKGYKFKKERNIANFFIYRTIYFISSVYHLIMFNQNLNTHLFDKKNRITYKLNQYKDLIAIYYECVNMLNVFICQSLKKNKCLGTQKKKKPRVTKKKKKKKKKS